ncbi:hypothetical protein RJ55_04343 [Drechmeria coniospora]|nr:hypothetical protein RJ55_04343 [Drechmeria coniospora]
MDGVNVRALRITDFQTAYERTVQQSNGKVASPATPIQSCSSNSCRHASSNPGAAAILSLTPPFHNVIPISTTQHLHRPVSAAEGFARLQHIGRTSS